MNPCVVYESGAVKDESRHFVSKCSMHVGLQMCGCLARAIAMDVTDKTMDVSKILAKGKPLKPVSKILAKGKSMNKGSASEVRVRGRRNPVAE